MEVYITKYALTNGIIIKKVEDCGDGVCRTLEDRFPSYYHEEGKDWHKTYESAKLKAEDMRNKKLISLKKQYEKLMKLSF